MISNDPGGKELGRISDQLQRAAHVPGGPKYGFSCKEAAAVIGSLALTARATAKGIYDYTPLQGTLFYFLCRFNLY